MLLHASWQAKACHPRLSFGLAAKTWIAGRRPPWRAHGGKSDGAPFRRAAILPVAAARKGMTGFAACLKPRSIRP
jgi:hypothetical protein